eukprot:TRINITY_DN9575_c0_g5_i1.p1 TRINITY_DN9575_c0_g5~~TRINITY_DN9575_c0_g5_i1.p1  ORF type:complete len:178 (+),score=22.69 TRINITY_DN9575_c0_g5_i1:64-534(+)
MTDVDQAQAHEVVRGHEHNEWDLVRISKKNVCTMRCRVCEFQVKIKEVQRCGGFSKGACDAGAKCRFMHVHKKKMTLERRVVQHGSHVLERVPPSLRKPTKAQAAVQQAAEPLPLPVGPYSSNLWAVHTFPTDAGYTPEYELDLRLDQLPQSLEAF